MTRIIIALFAILVSVNLYAGETADTFKYGPVYLESYKSAAGLIYDFRFPKWLEGTWWVRHYSDPGMDGAHGTNRIEEIPREPRLKMGRPFEFYGWLVRVPEGASAVQDYKAISLTEIVKGGWVLNMVSIEDPSKGAALLINTIKQGGSDDEALVFRWMHELRPNNRALYGVPLRVAGSIFESEEVRSSYLREKYITSPSVAAFDYKAWFDGPKSNKGEKAPSKDSSR